jgi:hypothetical protein
MRLRPLVLVARGVGGHYHRRVNPYFNLHPPAVPTLIK